jgi:5-oxoprolinase (ATP-hydrolysing)
MWQIWIDTGGTFTDCLARDPAGTLRRAKVLSSGALRGRVISQPDTRTLQIAQRWTGDAAALVGMELLVLDQAQPPAGRATPSKTVIERYEPKAGLLQLATALHSKTPPPWTVEIIHDAEAALLASRLVTGTPVGKPLPPVQLRVATTRGTNALLERRGASTALFVTRGFADLLTIGTQQRPDLFALQVRKPPPLPRAVVEVEERVDRDGRVLARLITDGALRQRALRLLDEGVRVAAVALVNSYRNPQHEQLLAAWLRDLGFEVVRCSTDLTRRIHLLQRSETATVDAYLTPIIDRFLSRVDGAARDEGSAPTLVMTSAGGLVHADAFRAKDSLLSGPAAGVVGAAAAAKQCGAESVIAFDMGGTSTDVARYAGALDYRFVQRVGDVQLATTALSIESVAAGGGSICSCRDGRLRVGPESAGAIPGPACYGASGPLTITDVNLLLGRLDPNRFGIPVQRDAASAARDELQRALWSESGQRVDSDELLEGLLEIANERMADAIRQVSLRRGYQPEDHALVAFGGAGPMHACGVARRLGIQRVIIPADAGLLSALGLGHAAVERIVERQFLKPLAQLGELDPLFAALEAQAHDAVAAEGIPPARIETRRRLASLRLVGQDTALAVDWAPGMSISEGFDARYRALYGYRPEDRAIELESLRVVAASRSDSAASSPETRATSSNAQPTARLRARFCGSWGQVDAFDRAELAAEQVIWGPAIVMDQHSTTVVEPEWRATRHGTGALVLDHVTSGKQPSARRPATEQPEAIRLELFANRLSAIAEEMGEMLRRTALSTNVKERLDFSCAILDPEGQLVVNAPHIPVHLGSLGLCVRAVREALPLTPGDVVVTNHPGFGGSHLPDVTVMTPVFCGETLLGYVANRAHHAEIGGCRPGSVPPMPAVSPTRASSSNHATWYAPPSHAGTSYARYSTHHRGPAARSMRTSPICERPWPRQTTGSRPCAGSPTTPVSPQSSAICVASNGSATGSCAARSRACRKKRTPAALRSTTAPRCKSASRWRIDTPPSISAAPARCTQATSTRHPQSCEARCSTCSAC